MKCISCGGYTMDEHNLCIECAEKGIGMKCTSKKCRELHV